MAARQLPDGYRHYRSIDLQKNKKLAIFVNVLAVVIAVCMLLLGIARQGGFTIALSLSAAVRMLVMGGSIIVYMVLHELIHGIFMRLFSGMRPRYGFTGLYAFAASDAYFGKAEYIAVALAPVVFLGVFLALLCHLLPSEWFWCCYCIQIVNLSGAAGDLYVTALMLFALPKDVLTQDYGVGMAFFSKSISAKQA